MAGEGFQNVFKVPELQKKILFTIGILLVHRIGNHIPTSGINPEVLTEFFRTAANTLFGMFDLFVGGGLQRASIFALGIMPYISSSIIFQLMTSVFPYFEKLQKEGEEGRKKITQYTRYGTVFISLLQSYGIAIFLETSVRDAVINPGWSFRLTTILIMTTGAVFLMWLGEQITERGIGNGMSLLIFFGIVSRLPSAIFQSFELVRTETLGILAMLFFVVMAIAIVAAVVVMTVSARKIPIQIPRKVVGRKIYGGQQTHIPLRINSAGVMPIIFASSIIIVPGTMSALFPGVPWMERFSVMFQPTSWLYMIVFGVLIVFFTYFYTAIIFNPVDLAENMKRQGGFVPGYRPGARTAEYIDRVLTRITLPGSFFLALIAIIPYILGMFGPLKSIPFLGMVGGTSVLIIVGVALDTIQQMESHLLLRHYDGFMKKGRIKGRRR